MPQPPRTRQYAGQVHRQPELTFGYVGTGKGLMSALFRLCRFPKRGFRIRFELFLGHEAPGISAFVHFTTRRL